MASLIFSTDARTFVGVAVRSTLSMARLAGRSSLATGSEDTPSLAVDGGSELVDSLATLGLLLEDDDLLTTREAGFKAALLVEDEELRMDSGDKTAINDGVSFMEH
jgi:hypothetical protein